MAYWQTGLPIQPIPTVYNSYSVVYTHVQDYYGKKTWKGGYSLSTYDLHCKPSSDSSAVGAILRTLCPSCLATAFPDLLPVGGKFSNGLMKHTLGKQFGKHRDLTGLQNRGFICPCCLDGFPAFVSYSYAKIFPGLDEWILDAEGQ